MSRTAQQGELTNIRGQVKKAQSVLRGLSRVLAIVEELERPDIIGRLVLPADKPVDQNTVAEFLRHCRRAEAGQDLTIVVLGAPSLDSHKEK